MQETSPVKYQFVSKITNEVIDLEKPFIVLVKAVAPDDEFVISTESTALAVEVNHKEGVFTPVGNSFELALAHRRVFLKSDFDTLFKESLSKAIVKVGGMFNTHLFFQAESKEAMDSLMKSKASSPSIEQFAKGLWSEFNTSETALKSLMQSVIAFPSVDLLLKRLEESGGKTENKTQDTKRFCDSLVTRTIKDAIYPSIRGLGWYVNSDSVLLSPYEKVVELYKDAVLSNLKVDENLNYLPVEQQDTKKISDAFVKKIVADEALNYGALFYQASMFNKKVQFNTTREFEEPVKVKKKTPHP